MQQVKPSTESLAPLDTAEPDAYDMAVAYLTEHPNLIREAWKYGANFVDGKLDSSTSDVPALVRAGCLFQFVGNSIDHPNCGCLTMVRSGHSSAATPELRAAILADERLPIMSADITPDHLPIFAGWQRRIDKALNRPAPVWR